MVFYTPVQQIAQKKAALPVENAAENLNENDVY